MDQEQKPTSASENSALLEQRGPIHLIGITARTSLNKELNATTAIIGKTVQDYFVQGIPTIIPNPINPAVTFCVYTDYESDYRGEYTYFIGTEVLENALNSLPEGTQALTIPTQKYYKITTPQGPMPQVCIEGWQEIWTQEQEGALQGNRAYKADFELYDHRASNPLATILDIYVGIKA